METAGVGYDDIDTVFLAGGFGYKIDAKNAGVLGLIPPQLVKKVLAVGNAALGGCTQVLISCARESEILKLVESSEEINLSTHPKFNELFMEYLSMSKLDKR